jgi:hypothetical protein
VCLVSGIEGDGRDRRIAVEQRPCGALQAEPAMQLERRLSHHAPEDAVEMERAQRGLACQRLEVERLVQRAHHALGGALHCLLVE